MQEQLLGNFASVEERIAAFERKTAEQEALIAQLKQQLAIAGGDINTELQQRALRVTFYDLPLSPIMDALPFDDRVRLGCVSREMQRAMGIQGPCTPTVASIERIIASDDDVEGAKLWVSAVKTIDGWLRLVHKCRYDTTRTCFRGVIAIATCCWFCPFGQ